MGLALAGGGPLGGMYETGALLALADSLEGLDLEALDVYVGVSSGSFVAAALANGISPAQMYRLLITDDEGARLGRAVFMRPAVAEFTRRALHVPALLARIAADHARHPLQHDLRTSLGLLARAIPTGLFDNAAIGGFLEQLFARAPRTNDFRRLRRKLFVVATHLDSGAPVVFGAPPFEDVPISRAIQASSALPGLFPPVEIRGRHYVDGALNKTLHASVALDQRLDLLLCVNPLVPFRAHRERIDGAPLHHRGLPTVLSQTFRAIIHSRMRVGMASYARDYPGTDILLLEPAPHDADMFFANIFGYAQRRRVHEIGFARTREWLRCRRHTLSETLGRHGIVLRRDRLDDPSRSVERAAIDARALHVRPSPTLREARRELDHVLTVLAASLEQARAAPTAG